MPNSKYRALLIPAAITGCVLLAGANPAEAASWNALADASGSWLYNDNPTLRPDDSPLKRDATSYGRIQGRGTVEYATPNSFVDTSARVSQTYYPKEEDEDLEATNYYVEIASGYSTPRNQLRLDVDYDNVGLLTDEFGDGVDNPDGGAGSGNTFRADDTIQRWRITPSWSYSLTERDSLTLNYSYFSADYRLEKTNRADNQNQQVNLSYRRSLNNRLGLGVTAAHRDFESEKLAPIAEIDLPLTNKSKSLGLTLDVNYQWSENTSFTGSFGRTNTDNERAILFVDPNNPNAPPGVSTTESDIKNTVYNVTFNRDTPRNTYFVLLSRGIVPSSTGAENTQNSFQFSFSRRLSEKLVGRINANGFDQQAINRNTNLSNEYRFLSASGSLSWRFVRDWVFSGVYTYRQNSNSFGDASSRGQSNQISATLTYRWD